jgi:hypothetical protein
MHPCGNCGQPRIRGKKFCTRCGTRFPDGEITDYATTAEIGYVPPATARPPHRSFAYLAAGGVVLAGIGVGAWFLVGPPGGHPSSSGQHGHSLVTSRTPTGNLAAGSPRPGSTTAGSTAQGSPSTGSAVPSPGPVAVTTVAARDPAVRPVTMFLDRYFTVINAHDYQAYVALLSPQEHGITQSQFDGGYGTTADTDETLSGISTAADGDSVAHVTFTSHQSAPDSPTSTNCNVWNISLYLLPNAGGYLIDIPPSSYRASFAACS